MGHMPPPDEPRKEEPELVTMSKLASDLGITRQWLHVLRTRDPEFPAAHRKPGSTRDLFDSEEVQAYYRRRLLEPGRRTDRELAKAVMDALAAGHSHETVAEQLSETVEKVRSIEAAERAKPARRKR